LVELLSVGNVVRLIYFTEAKNKNCFLFYGSGTFYKKKIIINGHNLF